MSRPPVLLDATALPADRGGVGRYVDALVAALVELDAAPTVVCLPRDADLYTALGVPEVVTTPRSVRSRPARLAWEQLGLPRLARRLGAAVLHSPHYTSPKHLRGQRLARVITLHDATFFTDPGVHSPLKAVTFRLATRWAVDHATRCVVPSQATRTEVVRITGADPRRIDVAPHGVDLDHFAPPDARAVSAVAQRLGLGGRGWIGFLATVEPRKDAAGLVRGWVHAFADAPAAAPALVLAGGSGWDTELPGVAETVPAGLHLVRPGDLPYEERAAFLGGAELVAYPRLGEGFGLPVLEAMAAGAAVLTSRRLSLPEVGGDAVAYAGTGPLELATALRALHADPAGRQRLGEAARCRAREFTWRRSAEAHLGSWERAGREVRA